MRRIRGAIGMGLTWAVAWAAVGAVPRWVFGFNTDAPLGLVFGVLGFVAGVIFFGLLVLTEGRRGFEELKISRFAAWGAAGGLVLAGIFARAASLGWGDVLGVAATFGGASAICAAGSLALARRAGTRELSQIREDTPRGELTD